MRYEQIKEGVEYGDLETLVDSTVSVAEFKPKTGTEEDVIVVGFYVKDEAPAMDLAKFIERGVTPILDTEVSPNPNDVGMYIVFVEVENEDLMKTTLNLINDIRGLVKVKEWGIKFYKREAVNVKAEEIREWLRNHR
ncbi:uncharacterized protein METZ01_LOCUS94495 [marine metagenome]|uniref:Uncharacterized protein n=1 Tax=marine metagenome TaxID=408172 RepID=A0A381VNJ9_9ZZZZ